MTGHLNFSLATFLSALFLRKETTIVMAFVSVFLRPPEQSKIVLPKVLQNVKFHLLAQGTKPKRFFLFSV